MENTARAGATQYLEKMIDQPLLYALKSPNTELYDFGFGIWSDVVQRNGKHKQVGTYSLHVLCRFKIMQRDGERYTQKYYEDTPAAKFHSEVRPLIGKLVKRIGLSDKNDLWLDFGDYWIVFATFENGEESWRFFTADRKNPHLVVADSWLEFVE